MAVRPDEDVVADRVLGDDGCMLEGTGDAQLGDLLGPHSRYLGSVERDGPSRRDHSCDRVEGCGLARAVGADEAEDLPRSGFEGHAIYGDDPAELHPERGDLHHGRQLLLCHGPHHSGLRYMRVK